MVKGPDVIYCTWNSCQSLYFYVRYLTPLCIYYSLHVMKNFNLKKDEEKSTFLMHHSTVELSVYYETI